MMSNRQLIDADFRCREDASAVRERVSLGAYRGRRTWEQIAVLRRLKGQASLLERLAKEGGGITVGVLFPCKKAFLVQASACIPVAQMPKLEVRQNRCLDLTC